MNLDLIGVLIRLRYKLLWAKTRTRGGKVALFAAGYLLLLLGVGVVGIAGAGGALIAVKSGQAERLAQAALTSIFAFALVTSVMLGYGLNEIFSDAELRRYPLRERERLLARHFTEAADPFWLLVIALDLGLAFGLYLFGAASFWLGLLAAALLLVCNYAAARLVAMTLERIMQMKGGSLLLPFAFMGLCLLPGTLAPLMTRSKAARTIAVRMLSFTPGFGAGSLMTRTEIAPALQGFALLCCWILGLLGALILMERYPARKRIAAISGAKWDDWFEKLGALSGPRYAPLVTHWLQFYFRSKRFRISYLTSVALVPFLLFVWLGRNSIGSPFASAVGIFAVAGLMPAAAFIVNQFGYVGGGFCRYFLFPVDPGDALRASSMTLLGLCSVSVVMAAAFWGAFSRAAFDVRGLAMLLASGVFGLFLFHGVGLWVTLFGARRCDPNRTMGNDLSLLGNIVVVGGMLAALTGPIFVGKAHRGAITPDRWLIMICLAVLAACFYFVSLRAAAAVFSLRRERLLKIVEGKGLRPWKRKRKRFESKTW